MSLLTFEVFKSVQKLALGLSSAFLGLSKQFFLDFFLIIVCFCWFSIGFSWVFWCFSWVSLAFLGFSKVFSLFFGDFRP